MLSRISSFIFMVLLTVNVSAESIDCSSASNFVEKEICSDGMLITLNGMLNSEYDRTYEKAVDKQKLIQSQKEWITIRNQCTTQTCLDRMISDRIHALKIFLHDEREQAQQQRQAELYAEEEARMQRQAQVAAENEKARLNRMAIIAAENEERRSRELAIKNSNAQVQQSYQIAASPSYSSGGNTSTTQSQERSWLSYLFDGPAWKWMLLAMVAITLTAMYQHHNETATVYIDYTDAMITNALPLLGLILYLLGSWLELPKSITVMSFYTCIFTAIGFGIYTAYLANGVGVQFVLVVIAKITLVSVFYALIAFWLLALMPTKYKDETKAQAQARNRRGARAVKVQIALVSVGYTFLTRWLCRYGEFAPLSETLSYSEFEV